jgi:hypothetical protein
VCGCKFHAACLIKYVADAPPYADIYSPCGTLLYERTPLQYDAASESGPEPVPPAVSEFFAAHPGAKAELKALKQIQVATKKAATAAKGFVRQRNALFKTEVAPLKQQIRQFRSMHKAAYRVSAERKAYQSALAKYMRAYRSFKVKYGVSRMFMNRLNVSPLRRYSPTRYIGSIVPLMRV